MSLPPKGQFPQPSVAWLAKNGQQALAQYLATLDALVSAMAQGSLPSLVNAANDAAAANAGVKINQMYRNGSTLMIRIT